jgi:hypothetical protein
MAIAFAKVTPASDDLMIHPKLDHLTLIITFATLESPCRTRFLAEIKTSKLRSVRSGPLNQFGRPDGAHDIEIIWNDEGNIHLPLKGFLNPPIGGDASLEDDRRKDFFPPTNIIEIILN